jgi:hypothetical protein
MSEFMIFTLINILAQSLMARPFLSQSVLKFPARLGPAAGLMLPAGGETMRLTGPRYGSEVND